jgi:vitamin B12 transporter
MSSLNPRHPHRVALACLAALSLPVSAQAAALESNPSLSTLPTINITATHDAPVAFAGVPSTTITRAQIDRLQATSVLDLLSNTAGLNLVNLGGPGKLTNVSIWGANASQTLVLVDGVRIGSLTAGQAYLENLPVALIDHIEIIRGPRSGQYGADAMGGVIQIFTRQGQQGLHPSFSIGGGSRESLSSSANLSGSSDHVDFSLGAAHQQTGGFNSYTDKTGSPYATVEPDQDGYHNNSAQGRIGYHADNGASIGAHWLGSNAWTDFDGSFQNQSRDRQQVFGLDGALMKLGPWQLRGGVGRSIDRLTSYENGAFASEFDSHRDTANLANDFSIGHGLLTLGADQTRDHVDSSTQYTIADRRNDGLYAQYVDHLGPVSFQTALRHDRNSQFGNANTGSLDLNWQLVPSWALTAGYGTGFRAPSFNDLYYPGYSNPNLQPERSHTARLGTNWTMGPWTSSVTGFRTRSQDLITLDANYIPQNISRAEVVGAEWQLGWHASGWIVNASSTWLSTRDLKTGTSLPRQPKWSGHLDLDRQIGLWDTGLTIRGQTQTHEVNATQINNGFATADLRLSYQFAPNWHAEAKLTNITNRAYQTAYGYNQAGRGGFLTIRYGR